jgi:heme A synthase
MLIGTGFVILMGGSIVGLGESFGCPGLPLCDDRSGIDATWLHGIHRVSGVLLLVGFLWTAFQVRGRNDSGLPVALNLVAALMLTGQIVIGVSAVAMAMPGYLRVIHLAVATLVWWLSAIQLSLALKWRRQ